MKKVLVIGFGRREKIDSGFLGWIWNYPKINKLKVEEKLRRVEGEKTIIRLKSKREVEDFFINYSRNNVLK